MKSPKSRTRNERLQRTIIQNHSFFFRWFPWIIMNVFRHLLLRPILQIRHLPKFLCSKDSKYSSEFNFGKHLWMNYNYMTNFKNRCIAAGKWSHIACYIKWNCQKVIPEINAIIPLRISLQMSLCAPCSIVLYAYIQKEPFRWHIM